MVPSKIFLLLLLGGCYWTCEGIPLITLPSVCVHSNQCTQVNSALKVCYDNTVYADWCEFTTSGCNGTARDNVSTVFIDPQCGVFVVVRSALPTHAPLSQFETELFHDAIAGIDNLLLKANKSGATVDQMKKVFMSQDHNGKNYTRNPQCWAYPLDLTPISPWNSQGHTRRAGVLVSPRHAVWARHYSIKINTTIRFVDRNNQVVDRKIVKTRAVPVNGSQYLHGYDIVVGELDSDVPSTISFVKILPKSISIIRPPAGMTIPVFDTDFEEKALVADLGSSDLMVSLRQPREPLRAALYEPKITGDSGNPCFVVLGDQLVLMFVMTYGGAGSGSSITRHEDDINTIMKSWGSGYQLTEVNLSHYLHGIDIPQVIG